MRAVSASLAVICIVFTGCSVLSGRTPLESYMIPAALSPVTETQELLESLPPPKQLVTASVYRFDDMSGQNKPGDTPQYSRAVTQGGLPLLKKALLDAGGQRWFRVLERGGLDDLLQERKIIRAVRDEYPGPDGRHLGDVGPLLYSGLLLEGGIVSYESNVLTGGAGAQYLGIGGSTQYRRDIVTVALRAVSVTSGEVLLAVTAEKAIFSTAVSAGVFKYVAFDKILESEAGFTVNEPPQLAVRQAIEMAVYSLVLEGVRKDLWQFADAAAGSRSLDDYRTRHAPRRNAVPAAAEAFEAPQPPAQQQSAPTEAAPVPGKEPLYVEEDLPKGYYVQVRAVKHEPGNPLVRKIVYSLKDKSFKVRIQSAKVESVRFYRIMVGPYPVKESAEELLDLLEPYRDGANRPFIRRIS